MDSYNKIHNAGLATQNLLQNQPSDIGLLIKEVQRDVVEECYDEINKLLWQINGRTIHSFLVRGLPEWYKERLAKLQSS